MEHNRRIERLSAWRRATRHRAGRLSVAAGALAVVALLGIGAQSAMSTRVVQADPQPTCVECPAGYHCVHNPEGCKPD